MQRMNSRLLKYDVEINCIPHNQLFLVDTLSRVFYFGEILNRKCV